MELGDSVIAHGWMAAPANLSMRWQFEFDDGLIARVVPLAGDWAVLGGRGFTLGQVAGRPAGGARRAEPQRRPVAARPDRGRARAVGGGA